MASAARAPQGAAARWRGVSGPSEASDAFVPGNFGSCIEARRVRAQDNRAASGNTNGVFHFASVAIQYNPFLYHNADPEADYGALYRTALDNGQAFSPNGGKTWFVVVHIKTPYHSK